jgi:hypothetical protein
VLHSPGVLNRLKSTARTTAEQFYVSFTSRAIALPIAQPDEQQVIVTKVERRLLVANEIDKELDHTLAHAERLR